ncbi:ATP-binding protein [Gemmatimonas groenlandica]|uniref:histidine kinase n=1 Tax=Gemmatimonas groenlandica TaxID=2732249 RepID=A0A6M4IUJ0_9BACT|nr:ATP-binding protein [Gemmatimonas groenlandica]QJR37429.1 response regulator [Gemmatimonas groenlandica]
MTPPPVGRPLFSPLSIRGRLQLAAILVASVITVLAFLRARERRAAEERRISEQSQQTATIVARSLDGAVRDAETLLNSLRRLVDLSAAPERNDVLLQALYRETPVRYSNIFLVDSLGRSIGAAKLPAAGRAAVALGERAYFQEALRTKRFTVGTPVRTTLYDNTPWFLPFIAPIVDSTSGRVRAMVGAGMLLDSLEAMHVARGLPSGSILSVIDSADRIVLRSRDADAWIGKVFPQEPRPSVTSVPLAWGTFVTSSIDSVERLFGAQTLTQIPWRVYVGIPTEYAFGPSRTQFTQDVLLGLLFSLTVVVLGYWIVARFVSPIESLTRDARAISTGDMARRSTIASDDEVGTLARTFNTMADAIVERNTELAASQEQLRQAHKLEALGSFAGGVAHDFNNYLSSIIGHSEMALADLPVASPVRDDVEGVLASAQRAAELTRQILIFSRQQAMAPQLLDPNDVITGIERMIARLLGESITLTLSLGPQLGVMRADRGQVEQVLMNLAANARDAMPSGGRFQITTSRIELGDHELHTPTLPSGHYIQISASDTGTGISAATRERMFEPFFTTKDRGRGTGLGLALAYGIVQQSGGAIHVASTEGRGTTFHIYFPLATAEPAAINAIKGSESLNGAFNDSDPLIAAAAIAPATVTPGAERILLVEDDDAVASATTRMLARAGYVVARAGDGQAGLDALASATRPYELVITDVVMPGMSGGDLAREISVRYPLVKVLFISGYPDDDELVRDVAEYQLPFLAKPFSTADLLQTVRRLLDAEHRVAGAAR